MFILKCDHSHRPSKAHGWLSTSVQFQLKSVPSEGYNVPSWTMNNTRDLSSLRETEQYRSKLLDYQNLAIKGYLAEGVVLTCGAWFEHT